MINIQIPFIYRFESQDKGPVHINTMDIIEITNFSQNSNWSVIKLQNGETYVSFLSPEDFVADMLNSYNSIVKGLK
jgi:hypothetical protein